MSDKCYVNPEAAYCEPQTRDLKPQLVIPLRFRWPVHQTDTNEIVIEVPTGGHCPVLHPDMIDTYKLSVVECQEAVNAVLKSIAIIH